MKLFFFCLFLLFCFRSFSQSGQTLRIAATLKDGTIVNGTLNPLKSKNTPESFNVYRENQSSYLLTPENTVQVLISDSTVYRSVHVTIYENITNGAALNETKDELPKEGSFFMQRLVKGNILSLYAIEKKEKTHFIIEDASGQHTCLRYVKYVDYSGGAFVLKDLPYYKDQLLIYAPANNQTARKKIMGASFTWAAIINAVTSINSSNEYSKEASPQLVNRRIFFPFVEVGAAIMNIGFHGTSGRLNALSFQNKFVPKLSAGLEVQPGKKKKLIIDLSVAISHYAFTGTAARQNSNSVSVQDKYEITATPIAFNAIINYSIFEVRKVKVALGGGYSFVINNIAKNSFSTTDTNADGSIVKLDQVSLAATSGQFCIDGVLCLDDKLRLRLVYYPLQSFSGQNAYILKTAAFGAGIRYRFY